MRSINKPLKSALGMVAAGKLALATSTAHADFPNGSKAAQLSITQGGTSLQTDSKSASTVLPLLEITQDSTNQITPKGEGARGESSSSATIYPGNINLDQFSGTAGEYINENLIVSGLNSQDGGSLDVYLVMSPESSDGSDWNDTASGFLLLQSFNFEVIGKATVDSSAVQFTSFPNSLVSDEYATNAFAGRYPSIQFSIPIERENFSNTFFSTTNTLYIQAIAFPAGTLDWEQAVVSSLYTFNLSDTGTGEKK